ncbi:MAG: 3-hydroxyacyl-CoA dehydrogenase/enoyl-CoA hydratase family protein [Calditrichaceae bacterium]|nr:3-hydroxyacyl-CoA dehydrogenase/enoyl-CoA hydratase family protein [Calditrichia bacterium]NUQ40570.1 3-hydroxyacyl-CoA dehydrogenase/enoyl-CoA hydratase family protein [Calditrichaceae bacterium]
MGRPIEKAAVLGAGLRGIQIAAQFANAGVPTLLFDVSQPAAEKGIAALARVHPAPLFQPENRSLIVPCNYREHLNRLDEAGWVLEAIVERADAKVKLFTAILPHLKPETIVSATGAGLSLSEMSHRLPPEFTEYFLITHFFHSPRYNHLLEMVGSEYNRPELLRKTAAFCENTLGKGVVLAKDTPGLLAYRIGIFAILLALALARRMNLPLEAADRLIAAVTGCPGDGIFGAADMLGLDAAARLALTIREKCPGDEAREMFRVPALLKTLLQRKCTGEKSGRGFYDRQGEIPRCLDWQSLEYRPCQAVSFPGLENAEQQPSREERIRALAFSADSAGKFVWEFLSRLLIYAANRIPETADDIAALDNAIKWGFEWEAGPFEIWDALGPVKSLARMRAEGKKTPLWVQAMIHAGQETFYALQKGATGYFDVHSGKLRSLPEDSRLIPQLWERSQSAAMREVPGASLWDPGQGVLCVEILSNHQPELNWLEPPLLDLLEETLEIIPAGGYKGLVIAARGGHFSAGTDLTALLKLCETRQWGKIEWMCRKWQDAGQRLRYAPFPVVSAPFHRAVNAGLELALAADRVVAAAEFYGGLAWAEAGLIPLCGGVLRLLGNHFDALEAARPGPFPPVEKAFETLFASRISTSAAEARALGYLKSQDCIVMNRDHLLYHAQQAVLELAENYRPPQPPGNLILPGEGGRLVLETRLDNLVKAGKISPYEGLVGKKLAYVLTGGNQAGPLAAVSEQTILDLEREMAVSLCREASTRERLAHFLRTGRRLRN